MALKPNRGVTWDVVAVPLAKGIDLRTRARLVKSTDLLVAENTSFSRTAGVEKRHGHRGFKVQTRSPLVAGSTITGVSSANGPAWSENYQDKTLPSNWVFGYGLFDPNQPWDTNMLTTGTKTVSPDPAAGLLAGAATRDNEDLVWDGFRLFSVPQGQANGGPCAEPEKVTGVSHSLVCPAAITAPIAKGGTSQSQGGMADNGTVRLVCWLEGSLPFCSMYDSLTGAPLRLRINLASETGLEINSALQIKCVPVGRWIHVFVSESANHRLYRITVNTDDTQAAMTGVTLGACSGQFDIRKLTEASLVAAINDNTGNIVLTYMSANGSPTNSPAPARTVFVGSGTATCFGFDVHPTTGNVCIVWLDTGATSIFAQVYLQNGSAVGAQVTLNNATISVNLCMTVGAVYIGGATATIPNIPTFVCFYEDDSGYVNAQQIQPGAKVGSLFTQPQLRIVSQAFRVGCYPFVFCTASGYTFQTTNFLMDCALRPVGKFEYGTASYLASNNGWVTMVNYSNAAGTTPDKDRLVWHTALMYNLRLASTQLTGLATTGASTAVFAETSIKSCYIDFLPKLRSAQAGRATYFAGAQLWSYDGRACTEAGFHMGPETVAATDNNTAGGLVAGNVYRYYAQLAYRNAQGEEIRGPGFLSAAYTVGVGKTSSTVNLPPLPTRRSDSYYLVYRNENNGVLWYLCSSRNPALASCPKNTGNTTIQFNDTLSDASLISKELCPANPATYLETYSAPACELVSSGRDRLWVAGGEIPAGQIWPSRLFVPNQVPSFHAGLAVQIDRGVDPITAIGFVEDTAAIFRKDHTYLLDGDGTDNQGNGGWAMPRLALAELGAVSQESIALIPQGLVFQSTTGFRLIGPGGELVPFGLDVDPAAQGFHVSATVVIPDDQQVRFYSPDAGALVYDYIQDNWSQWTGVNCWGAVHSANQRRAVLAKGNGAAWTEDTSLYTDDGSTYRQRIRTAWLNGPSLGGFQRVRRAGVLGEIPGTDFTLTARFFYDEQPFSTEEREWNTAGDLNEATWGDTYWGAGNWGDTQNFTELQDRVFRIRYRLGRQKCSAVSIELDDGACPGPGFVGTAVLLEIGTRAGMDRIPWRTTTQTVFVTTGNINNGPAGGISGGC